MMEQNRYGDENRKGKNGGHSRGELRRRLWAVAGIILIVCLAVSLAVYKTRCDAEVGKAKSMGMVLIDKETMTLRVIDCNGIVVMTSGIACGLNYGDKGREGDRKTPEGIFHISEIQDASDWTHDFGDGNGEIAGAYGPWFIRLETPPHTGIGIHGTHDPASIGTRASEGCIRLKNEDVERLHRLVYIGMPVVVTPGRDDIRADLMTEEADTAQIR